ncbi:MAG: type II and III secretion system protein family protein [Alphaproteobacteria bacterium]
MRVADLLILVLSIVLFILVAARTSAFAQQPEPPKPTPVKADVKPTGMSLEINKGRLIKLDEPASTVFIADPGIADIQVKSPTLVYIFGKKVGETTLIAVGDGERILLNQNVTVNHNLSRLSRTLKALMPGNTIQIRSVDGAIVLSGTAETPMEAEQARLIASRFVDDEKHIVNSIAVNGPNQVNLRVRVVEMSRQTARDLGIDWDAVLKTGSVVASVLTTSGAAAAVPVLSSFLGTSSKIGKNATLDISVMIKLLETEGLIRVLAEPNLTAMSGKTASFLAGGEFPIPVSQKEGVITIEFKKFGVGLNFTPTILSGSRINLKVAPEVSQLTSTGSVDVGGVRVPALTTRRADTTVELGSGQSLVIGGLLLRNVTDDLSQVPGIGSVPVIGRLFQSEKYQRAETELVIIVTPFIVKPVSNSPSALTTTDPVVPYRDPQRLVLGKKVAAKTPPISNKITGNVGFDLD